MKNTQKIYNKIHQFNLLAGNLTDVTVEKIDKQLDVNYEEVIETITAWDEKNIVEFIDGLVDSFVTLVGAIQQMEALGYNMAEALSRVCDNNLTKFIPMNTPDVAALQPENTLPYLYLDHKVYVFKNANGKVCKPLNYKPVELSDLAKKNLFEENV